MMMKQFLKAFSWGCMAILSAGSLYPVHAQSSSGSATPVQGKSSAASQEKPRAKKTWTEDNITGLRKPWDNYEEEKSLAARPSVAASASAKQQSANPASAGVPAGQVNSPSDPSLPQTSEDAEARIRAKEAE